MKRDINAILQNAFKRVFAEVRSNNNWIQKCFPTIAGTIWLGLLKPKKGMLLNHLDSSLLSRQEKITWQYVTHAQLLSNVFQFPSIFPLVHVYFLLHTFWHSHLARLSLEPRNFSRFSNYQICYKFIHLLQEMPIYSSTNYLVRCACELLKRCMSKKLFCFETVFHDLRVKFQKLILPQTMLNLS